MVAMAAQPARCRRDRAARTQTPTSSSRGSTVRAVEATTAAAVSAARTRICSHCTDLDSPISLHICELAAETFARSPPSSCQRRCGRRTCCGTSQLCHITSSIVTSTSRSTRAARGCDGSAESWRPMPTAPSLPSVARSRTCTKPHRANPPIEQRCFCYCFVH
jgi:hypothetical protein